MLLLPFRLGANIVEALGKTAFIFEIFCQPVNLPGEERCRHSDEDMAGISRSFVSAGRNGHYGLSGHLSMLSIVYIWSIVLLTAA